MESGILSDVLLPLAIVLIMIAMGMTLTGEDFRRLLAQPKAIAIGLVSQLIFLPAIAFGVAAGFGLETVFALSMILLASSPGGSTSNLIVHVSGADAPLSLTLTAISNVVAFVSLPVYFSLAQRAFGTIDGNASVPVADLVLGIAALTVVPIAIGMLIRAKKPDFALRMEEPGKTVSSAVLGIIIVLLVLQNWSTIAEEAPRFAPAFITMNVLALIVGFGFATLMKLRKPQAITVGVETGIQNATITIAVATSVLNSDDLALVPGLYGVWMLITGFAFAFAVRDRAVPAPAI